MIIELSREEALNVIISNGTELNEAKLSEVEKFLKHGNRYFYNETGKFLYAFRDDFFMEE